MSIKLIALDVDGTLVNCRQEVTPATRAALQAAADHGIHVVLATGRMLSECERLLAALPMIRFAITCTGAQTYDLSTGQSIARHSLTAPQLRQLCSLLWDLDVMLQIFDDHDGLMHNDARLLAEAERFCSPELAQAIRGCHAAEKHLQAYVEAYEGPTNKLHMFFGSRADKDTALTRLDGLAFEMMESQFTDLEIMAPGVDKGTGLQDLNQYLQLSCDQIMAIGDGRNDLGMLRLAGLPVAMGNSPDDVKELARWVTEDNDHDGVAAAVWRMLKEDGYVSD